MTFASPRRVDHGDVYHVETAYDSGLVEIGVYAPAVIAGAGPVLLVVADRMPGAKRWWVHGARSRQLSAGTKEVAVASAIELARKMLPQRPVAA